MDAVNFLQERSRMYKRGAATPCIGLEDDYDPVREVKVVEEWAAAHPRKTRQSVFLDNYPCARVDSRGVLHICPADVCGNNACPEIKDDVSISCYDCRHKFWMQDVECMTDCESWRRLTRAVAWWYCRASRTAQCLIRAIQRDRKL